MGREKEKDTGRRAKGGASWHVCVVCVCVCVCVRVCVCVSVCLSVYFAAVWLAAARCVLSVRQFSCQLTEAVSRE